MPVCVWTAKAETDYGKLNGERGRKTEAVKIHEDLGRHSRRESMRSEVQTGVEVGMRM